MATATRLTPQQRQSLTDDGYLLVPSLLDPADLAPIAARLAEHVRQTVATWAEDPSLDTHGGAVTTRFDLDDPGLAPCYQHPQVADAATTVLAEGWYLQALQLRAPIPGSGEKGPTRTSAKVAAPGPPGKRSGHVVHQRVHQGQRAAAGDTRLPSGQRAADRHRARVRHRNGPAHDEVKILRPPGQ